MKRALETSTIADSFVDFTDAVQYPNSNFTIVTAGGKKVFTNRQLLSIYSGYFSRYLTTSMRERGREHSECPDYDSETINLLVNYMMFAGKVNVYPVVRFASERGVDIAKLLQCADYLGVVGVSACVDNELCVVKPADILKYTELSVQYNMEKTKDIITRDSELPATLLANKSVPFAAVKELASRYYIRKNFADVHIKEHLMFIEKWIDVDSKTRSGYLEEFVTSLDIDVKKNFHRKQILALFTKFADDATLGRFARKYM